MNRINLIATVTLTLGALMCAPGLPFARNVESFSQAPLQTFPSEGSVRRIPVNAQTIAALAPGKKFVVDLTQRGVKYEFDPQRGTIDFTRVTIRAAGGEATMGSILERTLPRDKLSAFRLSSQSFILGTQSPGTVRTPSRGTTATALKSNFTCGSISCQCKGEADCVRLILRSGRCGSYYFCYVDGDDGEMHCYCRQP